LSGTRRIELVQDFALPVPAMVLAEVLGLPANDMSILIQWVEAVATAHNITQPPSVLGFGGICAMAMRTYYDALVTENQTQSGGGMLAGVCSHIGEDLTLHDVEAVMSDMLVAGFLTTTYLISTGIRSLLAHPDQADAIRADPSLLPAAIEEMLRFDSPAPLLDRQVAVPTTLGGVSLQPGARVVAAVASANRDPQAFENPDVFDVRRVDTTQLGFGDGIHYCIGAPLARLVAPAAIAGLLKLPNLRINGIEQWQPDPYLRGLTSLPMAYD
jgi:cytochrome P450